MNDYRKRFLFEDLAIRGELCRLDNSLMSLLAKHNYPVNIEQLVVEVSLATILLSSILKYEGTVTLQLQSAFKNNDHLHLLMAECTEKGEFRAIARYDDNINQQQYAMTDLMPSGHCAFTLIPKQGQRYQGIVQLTEETIADNLSAYFKQSEQLATQLYLFYENKQAFGLLLQQIPSREIYDEDGWNRVNQLAQSLTIEEALMLESEQILHRLYHEETVRHFESMPVQFKCSCSKERFANAMLSLGKTDLEELFNENEIITSQCEFCLTEYQFDKIDVEFLFYSGDVGKNNETLQ